MGVRNNEFIWEEPNCSTNGMLVWGVICQNIQKIMIFMTNTLFSKQFQDTKLSEHQDVSVNSMIHSQMSYIVIVSWDQLYGTRNSTGNPVHLPNLNPYPTGVLSNPNSPCHVFQLNILTYCDFVIGTSCKLRPYIVMLVGTLKTVQCTIVVSSAS